MENEKSSILDLETFQYIVTFVKKLPKEHLELALTQVDNFTEVVKAYMASLHYSQSKNHQLITDYQDTLLELLKKEDNDPEIRMQVLSDLRELQKRIDRQMMIDKFHLDKVAAGGMTVIGAVLVGVISNKQKK